MYKWFAHSLPLDNSSAKKLTHALYVEEDPRNNISAVKQ